MAPVGRTAPHFLVVVVLATAAQIKTVAANTDIYAVYKHSVLLIKNANEISESQKISWEDAKLDLPENFQLAYPVGIASDPKNQRLFVTDVMNRENNIFTLQLSSNGSIAIGIHPLLKKTHPRDIRLIEDIIYDGRRSQLYWTDSYLYSLNKAHVPNNPQDMLTDTPKPVHHFGSAIKPRGVALDYCNNLLYWSERNDKERNIEVCNLDGTYLRVAKRASDSSNKYFLGMTYDSTSGHVIWGEIKGKGMNSTCRIMSSDFRGTPAHESNITKWVELDNCYPFALTSDDEYIYWSDWSRNGIMRLSKAYPDQVVKILDAPKVESDKGTHKGVHGLTVFGGTSLEEIDNICSHHQKIPSLCGQHTINPGESLKIQSANYPRKYPNNEKCEWEIKCTGPNATIDLSCYAFNIFKAKTKINCTTDYLTMFHGNTTYTKACGKDSPKGVVSTGNQVTIKFVSNEVGKRSRGFDCTVKCIALTTTTTTTPTVPV